MLTNEAIKTKNERIEQQSGKLLAATKAYFNAYMQDEAEDAECCTEHQHKLAKAVQVAIAEIEASKC